MNNPLPSAPGALLGHRKNGQPIRLIAGGSEAAPEPPAGDPPASPPEPSAPQPPAPQGEPQPSGTGQEPPAQPPAEPGSVEQLPPWAQKLIRDTRTEAASNRAKAKEHSDALTALQTKSQAQLDGIAKALGLKPEEATPEQILAERDAERARAEAEARRAREAAVELAVFRAAATEQVNGNALLDSRSFVATLAGLDPAAEDFSQRVKDAITAAVEANPQYKLTPPAPPPAPRPEPSVPRSGPGQFTGAPDGPRQLTEADAKNMTAAEVIKAMNEGLFTGEGFGPRRGSRR